MPQAAFEDSVPRIRDCAKNLVLLQACVSEEMGHGLHGLRSNAVAQPLVNVDIESAFSESCCVPANYTEKFEYHRTRT